MSQQLHSDPDTTPGSQGEREGPRDAGGKAAWPPQPRGGTRTANPSKFPDQRTLEEGCTPPGGCTSGLATVSQLEDNPHLAC